MSVDDLARQAADSVRAVMGEAQKQAAEIVAAAEAEARQIRERAEADARERVEKAREVLEELSGRLGMSERPPAPVAPVPQLAPAEPEPLPAEASEPEPTMAPEEPPNAEPAELSPEPTPAPVSAASRSGDAQAARLVALKLALDGVSKDEARTQLASEYDVADLDSLLGDVYTRAGR